MKLAHASRSRPTLWVAITVLAICTAPLLAQANEPGHAVPAAATGDFNADGSIDSDDCGFLLEDCLLGPGLQASASCAQADLIADDAVDLADVAKFQLRASCNDFDASAIQHQDLSVQEGGELTFTAADYFDWWGGGYTLELDFGPCNVYELPRTEDDPAGITFKFQEEGDFDVILSATRAECGTISAVAAHVTVEPSPTFEADFSVYRKVRAGDDTCDEVWEEVEDLENAVFEVGEKIRFDARATLGDLGVFWWGFGQAGSASGITVVKQIEFEGDFPVQFTAYNGEYSQQSTVTKVIRTRGIDWNAQLDAPHYIEPLATKARGSELWAVYSTGEIGFHDAAGTDGASLLPLELYQPGGNVSMSKDIAVSSSYVFVARGAHGISIFERGGDSVSFVRSATVDELAQELRMWENGGFGQESRAGATEGTDGDLFSVVSSLHVFGDYLLIGAESPATLLLCPIEALLVEPEEAHAALPDPDIPLFVDAAHLEHATISSLQEVQEGILVILDRTDRTLRLIDMREPGELHLRPKQSLNTAAALSINASSGRIACNVTEGIAVWDLVRTTGGPDDLGLEWHCTIPGNSAATVLTDDRLFVLTGNLGLLKYNILDGHDPYFMETGAVPAGMLWSMYQLDLSGHANQRAESSQSRIYISLRASGFGAFDARPSDITP